MTLWTFILLGLFISAIYVWAAREQRREKTVLNTSYHPELGEIRHYRSGWEANIIDPAWEHPVSIWGDDPEKVPQETSLSSLRHIKQNYPLLLSECVEGMKVIADGLDIQVSTGTLRLESIDLYSDNPGYFSLNYELPAFKKKVPNGLSACFEDFKLEEISDNH